MQNAASSGHALVQDHSDHFAALGSTGSVDARVNTVTTHTSSDRGAPIYWLNGPQAADQYQDFYDGSWDHRNPARDEDGESLTPGDIFTGSNRNGTEAFDSGTSRALGKSLVRGGSLVLGAGKEISDGGYSSSNTNGHFYGLSYVFRIVDTDIPFVVRGGVEVTSTPEAGTNTYGAGEDIEITVTFNEPVVVTGTPQFGFSAGVPKLADLVSGSGATQLVFAYTVQSGDEDTDGIWIPGHDDSANPTFRLDPGDAVTGVATDVDAILQNLPLGTQSGHKVDGSLTGADARLSSLSLSGVTLAPAFAAGTTAYTASAAIASTTVTATASQSGAVVVIAPVDADTNTTDHEVTLAEGDNTITVTVTGTNTTSTRTYTITVNRAEVTASSDADLSDLTIDGTSVTGFAASTASYTVNVPNSTTQVTVAATKSATNASVEYSPADAATAAGHQVDLSVGNNTVTVTVTAEDGTTTKAYTVTVIRATSETIAPSSASVSEDGTKVSIVFDEDLDSSSTLAPGEFAVTVGTASAVNPSDVELRTAEADTVVLTMGAAITAGETVSVDYTAPSTGGLQNSLFNTVATFTGQAVLNRPAAPALTLVPAAGQITASWDAPADGGSTITGYDVKYKAEDDDGYTTVSRADVAATSEIITNLVDGTEYTVQARAVNAAGRSPWAEATAHAGESYPAPGGPFVFWGNTRVLVRWIPAAGAAEDSQLLGWLVQWKTADQDWSSDRERSLEKLHSEDYLNFETNIGGLSNGTEVEFRVRARVADRTAAWTAGAAATPASTATNLDGDAFDTVRFLLGDVTIGIIHSDRTNVHYHDEATRSVTKEGLVDYTIRRTFYLAQHHIEEPVPPITALKFALRHKSPTPEPVVTINTLHEGAGRDWASLEYPPSYVDIPVRLFRSFWEVRDGLGRTANGDVTFDSSQTVSATKMPTVTADDVALGVPVSLDRALKVTWQEHLLLGPPHTDETGCVQWRSGSEEFEDYDDIGLDLIGDRTIPLRGQTLTDALIAASYTLTGLDRGVSYDVRMAWCSFDGGSVTAISNVVTGTTLDGAPEPVLVVVPQGGMTVDIVFDEDLDTTRTAPAASAFAVIVGTAESVPPSGVAFHSTDHNTIALTMATAIADRPPVSVEYTKPLSNALADDAGYEVDSFPGLLAVYPPTAPGTPTLTPDDTALNVAWTAPTDDGGSEVTGYEVQWRTNSQTWDQAIAAGQTADATASPYEITGLTNLTEYVVRVIAANAAGSGPASSEQTATPMPPPTIVKVEVTSTPQAATDTYGLGEDIEITVTFDEAVTVTGAVDFGLSVNGPRRAPLVRGNGTAQLVFAYTVQAGVTDTNGIFIGNQDSGNATFALQAGQSIVSVVGGLDAVLEHTRLETLDGHKVNGALTDADARLSALSLSGITLEPPFTAAATSYTASAAAASTTVTATASQSGAVVVIDPADADTNTTDHEVTLAPGENTITVTVTSTNGNATRTYTITVNRGGATLSSNADLSAITVDGTSVTGFSAATTAYNVNVGNSVAQVTVAATKADTNASVAYDPADADTNTGGHQVDLSVGNNTVTVTVTAEDGTTTKAYTLTIVRAAVTLSSNADLSAITVDGTSVTGFSAATTAYNVNVENSVARVTVAATKSDTNATVVIDPADAGSATGHQVDLSVGNNTVTVTVTAEDGTTTKAYTLTIVRAATASSNADLSNLTIDGTRLAGFSAATTNVTVNVGDTQAQVTVAATKADTNASVAYSPADADTGTNGHQVNLSVGNNTVTITVTAEDGTTTKTYTLTLARAGRSNANLSALTVDGTSVTGFSAATTAYNVNVAGTVDQVTIAATASDTGASLVYSPTDADTNTGDHQVNLSVGDNTVTITATAEDGTTTKAYTLTIVRAAGDTYAAPGGPFLFWGNGKVLVRWIPPADALDEDTKLLGWLVQWKTAVQDWSSDRERSLEKLHRQGYLNFDTNIGGLSNGTEVEFRVRARVEDRTAAWTAGATTTPASTATNLHNLQANDMAHIDVDGGTIRDDSINVGYHDEEKRTVTAEGLVDYTIERTYYILQHIQEPVPPMTALRFTLEVKLPGSEPQDPIVTITTLHEGADHDSWASLRYPSSMVEIPSHRFELYWKVDNAQGQSADGFALLDQPQMFGTLDIPTVDADVVMLGVPVSLDRALELTWQEHLWVGAPQQEEKMCVQWRSGSEDFEDADDWNFAPSFLAGNRTVVLHDQTLTNALIAASYTLTGLDKGVSYDVRTVVCDFDDVTVTANSNVVTGTTLDGAPEPVLVVVPQGGMTVDIVFDEDLDTTRTAPAASAFAVTVGTAESVPPSGVAFHSTDHNTITLTMATAIAERPPVSVEYTKPSSNALADDAGYEVDSFPGLLAVYPPTPPGTPTLTPGDTALDVAWTAPDDDGGRAVTGYTVQWRVADQDWDEAVDAGQTESATASPYEITGLTNFTAYWVRVVAVNAAGNSPASPEQTATPHSPPMIASVAVTSTPQADAANNTYGLGEDIEITVTFDQAVTVTGDVDFGLSVNGPRRAPLVRGNGTAQLVFAYTVQATDRDDDGIWIGHPSHDTNPTFALQAGQSIVGVVGGIDAVLNHPQVGPQADHKLNGSLSGADATLSGLSLSGITLDQTFAAATTSYTASAAVATTTVTATASQSGAGVAIDPADANASASGHQVALVEGNNTITVTVTSTNGNATRTYTITIDRAAVTLSSNADLSDLTVDGTSVAGFAAATTAYTVNAGNSVAQVTVAATKSDTNASAAYSPTDAATATGHQVDLVVGNNTVTITVTAEDGTTTKTYTLTIVRAADDAIPQVTAQFGAASYFALEGRGAVTITVTLSADPERSVTIPISVSAGGGAGSGDYSLSPSPASVTFNSGDTSATFTVTATDDMDSNPGKNLTLGFGMLPEGVTEGSQATATVALTDNEIPATSSLVPAGAVIGDAFRLLFVTSGKRNAQSLDIADYNRFVQSAAASGHADIQSHSGQFQALASTADVDARDNTGTTYTSSNRGVPIWWLNGPKAADQYQDFYDRSWDHRDPGRTEDGDDYDFNGTEDAYVWTGTGLDGAASLYPLGGSRATYADPSLGAGNELVQGVNPSNSRYRMYGLSFVLHVAPPADTPYVTGVEAVSPPSSGSYFTGDTITLAVTFSEEVAVTGAPTFPLSIGSDTRQAQYQSAASTATRLVFSHVVTDDDDDNKGISNAEVELAVPTGTTITRKNDATVAAYPGSIVWDPDLKVNPIPRLTSIEFTSTPQARTDTYGLGEDIEITVTFDIPVTVTGGFTFGFYLGGVQYISDRREASLTSGDGATQLVFTYTVVSSDSDDDGIWVGESGNTRDPLFDPFKFEDDQSITGPLGRSATLTHPRLDEDLNHLVDGSLTGPGQKCPGLRRQ